VLVVKCRSQRIESEISELWYIFMQ
jgi:hypothetical protein